MASTKPDDLLLGKNKELAAAVTENPVINDDDFITIHRLNWTDDEAERLYDWLIDVLRYRWVNRKRQIAKEERDDEQQEK